MTRLKPLLIVLCLFVLPAAAQQPVEEFCSSARMMNKWLENPANRSLHEQVERQVLAFRQSGHSPQRPNAVVTLPVVVHIIHNNGPENISDAQVLQGIQHLNQAFANLAPYDPGDGVDCQVQFCLARRDPDGNATNGITRTVSALTNMNMNTEDFSVKNLNRWNPLCYINIWLVNEICSNSGCGVAGYAYLPGAHGSNVDGIVQEARWFGTSPGNSGVQIHEMGHYLGLYHTFEGGCTNNNCLTDGDRVCDTPPDASTVSLPCGSAMNSCSTDVLSGFATDQNDLTRDYMDYGNLNCYSIFTQGQADRMNWHIINVRSSLLNCMSCLDPCPAPVTANCTTPGATVAAGSSYTFTNLSVNAASYEWYVNNVLVSTATHFNYTFSTIGPYVVKLVAKSSGNLCAPDAKIINIQALCPVVSLFTRSAAIAPCGTNISFANTSTGATTYEWFVNNVSQSTSVNFSYTNATAGRYEIKLVARSAVFNCAQQFTDTVEFTCPVIASFTPNGGTTPINTPVTFTNTSTGATSYQWLVNGGIVSASPNLAYSFTAPGNYSVLLLASNGTCSASKVIYYTAVDTCRRYTFQKLYGTPTVNEEIYDIASTPDGGFIGCGGTTLTASGLYDCWVVKYDHLGAVQWSRSYGTANVDNLLSIKPVSGGGYIATGSTAVPGGLQEVLVIRIDGNGNLVWSNRYGENTAQGYNTGSEVIETSDGGFLVCGKQPRQAIGDAGRALLLKMDAAGNLQWGRVYSTASGYDEACSVVEENGYYTVAGSSSNPSANTRYDLFLLKVNKSDGSVISVNGYDLNNNMDDHALKLAKPGANYELSYYMNPLNNVAEQMAGVLRIDAAGTAVHSKYVSTANTHANAMMRPTPDGGYIACVIDEFFSTALQLYKFGSPMNLQWGYRYPNTGGSLLPYLKAVTTAADGGYLAGGVFENTTGIQSREGMLVKTDIAGNTTGCNNTPETATLVNTTVTPVVITLNSRALNPVNQPAISLAVADKPVSPTVFCADESCSVLEDTCSLITFQKSYGTFSEDYITDVKNTPGGGFIAAGVSQAAATGGDGVIIKLDNKGDIIWHKALLSQNADNLQRIINTSDGGYLAAGYTIPPGGKIAGWMVKLDGSGNIQWTKKYTDGNPDGSVIWDVCQTSDGGYAFCGVNRYTPGLADAMVGKTDANGNVQWCKSFNGTSSDQAWGILEANGQLIVSAFGVGLIGGQYYDGAFMKLNMANGNVLYSRGYDIEGRSNWFLRIKQMPGGKYLVDCNNNNDYTNSAYNYINLVIDSVSGLVNNIIRNNAPTDRSGADAVAVTSDGGFMVTQSEGSNADAHFRKNSPTGVLQQMKKYGSPTISEGIYSIVEAPDKGIFGGGYKSTSNRDFFFIKTGPNGSQGGACPVAADVGDNSIPAYATALFSWQLISTVNIQQNNATDHVATQFTISPVTSCGSIADCNTLDISGADSVCRMQDTVTYQAIRSSGCSRPVSWTVTPAANAQVIATTDSTIKIKFLLPGYIRLRGVIQNNCSQSLEDTLGIMVFHTPVLNLGPDIALCAASTYSLHAGPGFKTYRWQDGATDSVYTTYQPGTYWVVTEDICGNISRDTVVISVAPPVPFNLGPDLFRCNNDTVTIAAPAGFTSYTWSANYNINTLNGRTVRVWPAVDTVYTVVAESAPGCQVFDTIRVKVGTVPVIRLGNDTSFCAGGMITLDAGSGFASYLWSTGAITQTITVNTAGTYWVEGTAASGCKSRDTLRVLNVFALPFVNIGADTSICQGTSIVLDPGAGFTSYLWQNGSTAQTQVAATVGLYWVNVVTANGCTVRDSMRIFAVHANPPVSIGNDTSFCTGGSVTLTPTPGPGPGWISYLWQDGSTAPTFTAATPGLYWVQVHNGGNFCYSRDSMRVLNVYPLPAVNIGRDTVLCNAASITLNPGSGFVSYLWQDGSVNQLFTTAAAGTYWVRVVNGNGCATTDTMRVTAIGATPANFVLPRVGICDYETIFVHAVRGYRSYLWSTGATADSALIVRPGNYWLQVISNEGCTATENIEVYDKNCPQNIYFPTAFSPNHDGVNDVYKPALYGTLKEFRLEIFNRFGERVFFTTDAFKGWDGTYKGKAQGTGIFVWQCSYRIKDQDAVFKKGTLALVR